MSTQYTRSIDGGEVQVACLGVAGDPATAHVSIVARGSRGGEKARALYLSHNADMLAFWVVNARAVVAGHASRASIARDGGGIRFVESELGSSYVKLRFNGRRNSTHWEGNLTDVGARRLLLQLENAAIHLTRRGS